MLFSAFAPVVRSTPRLFAVGARARAPAWSVSRTLTTTSRWSFPPVKKETKPTASETKATKTKEKTTAATKTKKTGTATANKEGAAKPRPVGRPRTKLDNTLRKLKPEEKPPKQPGSPYSSFSSRFLSSQPAGGDIRANITACGEAWKALSDAEKQPYITEWETKRAQYVKDRAAYWDNVDPSILGIINKQRKKNGKKNKLRKHPSDENKRPMTAYFRFCQERRKHPEVLRQVSDIDSNALTTQQRIMAIVGQEWNALSDSEKEPYQLSATKALEEWRARYPSIQATV